MHITVRPAGEADFPAIYSMIQEFSLFQGTPDKVTITPGQMVADKDRFRCLVAEAEGVIVGFASFFPAYYSWTGRALYLDDLYVTEAWRKRGIGKQLLTAIIDLAAAEGCRKVRWQVSKWNTHAIAFYQSMGAAIDDVEINCDLVIIQG